MANFLDFGAPYESRVSVLSSTETSLFERGLQNAIKDVFNVSEDADSPKLLGCYFHFVKALIKKAKELKLFLKNSENKNAKLLVGLLKILVHIPKEKKQEFFTSIEATFKNIGTKYETLLKYF